MIKDLWMAFSQDLMEYLTDHIYNNGNVDKYIYTKKIFVLTLTYYHIHLDQSMMMLIVLIVIKLNYQLIFLNILY